MCLDLFFPHAPYWYHLFSLLRAILHVLKHDHCILGWEDAGRRDAIKNHTMGRTYNVLDLDWVFSRIDR
jgi:hypothetical protein